MKSNSILLKFICLTFVMAAGCTDLDDVKTRLDKLESRMTALEIQVNALNGNVQAVSALMEAGTIASATEADGVWTIVLSDGRELKITQGTQGVGAIPVMTVDDDGYWMVDYGTGATYILCNNNKVKASGDDGITPVFGVNEAGNWTVSYDGGDTFEEVPGADGAPVSALPSEGGDVADPYFKAVDYTDGVFTLVLRDDRTLVIPVVSGFICAIEGAGETVFFEEGETKQFNVTITGAVQTIVTAPRLWNASVEGAVLSVTAPVLTRSAIADSRTDVSILAISAGGAAAVAKLRVSLGETPQPPQPPVVVNDLYQAYLDGGDITIAGISYNKVSNGEPVLLTAENAVADLRASIHQKSGVFFLEQSGNGYFVIPSVTEITGDVVLVSRYANNPVTLKPEMCTKLRSGSLVMKNIIFDMAGIDGGTNASYAFNNANATADFARWHFDGCRILNLQKPVLYANVAGYGFVSLIVKDCVIQLVYTSGNVQLFNFYGSTVLHTYKELVFSNNVVFNAAAQSVQVFQYNQNIAQNGSPWECTLEADNNIFYNCPSPNGYFKFYRLSSLKMKGNIFWASAECALTSYGFILYSASQDASVIDASGNIAYGLAAGKNWLLAHGNSTVVPPGNTMPKEEENPFATFDTATGEYTLLPEYITYGPQK